MRLFVIIVITCTLIACTSIASTRNPEAEKLAFAAELRRIAGSSAIDCGLFPTNSQTVEGAICIRNAWKQHTPFIYGGQYQGNPATWYGFAGNVEGQIFSVNTSAEGSFELSSGLCTAFNAEYGQIGGIVCNTIDQL